MSEEFHDEDLENDIVDEGSMEKSAEEFKEDLINEVRKRSIMYNAGSNSNRNKHLKEAAWISVAAAVKSTGK